MIGLYFARDLLVCRLQIRAHNWESQVRKEVSQLFFAAIKFMITKSHGVEFELIESLCDLFSAIKGIEQRSLELVADIQPKAVIVLGTLFFDDRLHARVTTKAATFWSCAVRSCRRELVQMSVDVVDVEEGYLM
jgi:hypothetical protein